ncbi:MAG: hypothetical protein HYX76_02035 [Acidobacteria bacterium]|nr:hypothetical protein [Acidobacteriota bacterium]
MHIDSARELKAVLLDEAVRPLAEPAQRPSALAIAARPLIALDPTPRTIALGITGDAGRDVHLAIRIQNEALLGNPVIQHITRRARGEVDIRYVGRITKRAAWNRSRQRPLLMGASIGHYRITAGTLGAFVTPLNANRPCVLSNNHVLADENRGKKGDAVIQPGRFDGGRKGSDTVATLEKFVRVRPDRPNKVDAAVARLRDGIGFDGRTLRQLGMLRGTASGPLDSGTSVSKVGRTTGVSHGRITAFEMDNLVVAYDTGNLRFDDQIEIEGADEGPFSAGGDSGSLVVDGAGSAVGLLFAGGDQGGSNGRGLTYANAIGNVLPALAVDLIT